MKYTLTLLFALFSFAACDTGFQTIGGSERGVVFSALPIALGGGLREDALVEGERELLMPWESLYRLDTSWQNLTWGGKGQGDNPLKEDYVETRAADGNEVGLAMTVQYRINPDQVAYVVKRVAPEMDRIRKLVASIGRADIRTHMNVLNTRDFFNTEKRQVAVDSVKKAMRTRLEPEGIIIGSVIYLDHRFERNLADGSYDRSYQEQIDSTQVTNQQTEQEVKKIRTVVEDKRREYNEEQGRVNRVVAEVEGRKRQAELRGDSYLQAKQVEAQQIKNVGLAEVEGLKKRIEALSGPGGEALLRLELIKYLTQNKPKYFLLNSPDGKQSTLDFNRVDTNELIRQIGLSAAAVEGAPAASKPKEKSDSSN